MANFGDIPINVPMGAGQSIRRNAADSGFEAYSPGQAASQSSASRSLNTNFVPNENRSVLGVYSVEIVSTLSISGGQYGTVFLEISADGSSGWVELCRASNGNTGTLTIGLNTTQTIAHVLSGVIPAGYTARMRTANSSGSPTYTYLSGQEAAL